MPTPVELPKLGNTVEECLIARWVKHPGDAVAAEECVLEIETDKAVQEIASPVGGILLAAFFQEGEYVPVFTNIFVIGEPGEDAQQYQPAAATNPHYATPAASPAPVQVPKPEVVTASRAAQSKDPVKDPVEECPESDDFIPVAVPAPAAPLAAPLSPRARRFAEEHHFHPADVQGSGPGGRILEADLQKLYTTAKPAAEPLPRIRQKIAQRMRESINSTAQYTLHTSANAAGLLALRARIKASPAMGSANINDMVMFCTVRALLDVPELNVEFVDGQLIRHAEVHLGMAVDSPRGLMVPVIRNAHQLPLAQLAQRARELAAQVADSSISPDDLSGATFTVSNLGNLGIESFTPILNPPQVAILGVDAIQLKPVRREAQMMFIDAIGLSLTLDHQIIDGAPGARFLNILRSKIEAVETLTKETV